MDLTAVAIAQRLALKLTRQGLQLATAESCTGGGVAQALTAVPGSSAFFGYGLVTYANAAKTRLLGVSEALLAEQGAVSRACALAMAEGVRALAGSDWGLATTGIAGPEGGSPDKPVGTVWLAWAGPAGSEALCLQLPGDRAQVRAAAVRAALEGLEQRLITV